MRYAAYVLECVCDDSFDSASYQGCLLHLKKKNYEYRFYDLLLIPQFSKGWAILLIADTNCAHLHGYLAA